MLAFVVRLSSLIVVAVLLPARPALAHTGPPFAVVQNQQLGPYTATIWADPDVNGGSIIVEATRNGAPLPDGSTVTIYAQPAAGGAEVNSVAQRQQTDDGRIFIATVPFGSEGDWTTRVVVEGPDGRGETSFKLTVTPAVENWILTAICLLPFVGLGVLWLFGLRAQRRRAAQQIATDGS